MIDTKPVRSVPPTENRNAGNDHHDHNTVARNVPDRPKPTEAITERTRETLQDHGRRNRESDERRASEIHDSKDAKHLISSILGGAAAGAITSRLTGNDDHGRDFDRDHDHDRDHGPGHGHFDAQRDRLPASQVGRSDQERRDTVNYLVQRLNGRATLDQAPPAFRRDFDSHDRDWRDDDRFHHDHERDWDHDDHHHHHPHYFDGNRRVVWYASRSAIPAILLASNSLNYVDVTRVYDSPYRSEYLDGGPDGYYDQIPPTYRDDDAYAVSYSVDPNSAISQDDILFVQGSTDLADAYSYDLVVDMAEAMTAPELGEAQFVIEGHASAEGSYDANLELSQERAERIARDLVNLGVSPDRLIPVGYGETEAEYPADAPESLRALDRRVMVFRKE
ncbi:MAG: OmpA family protein [Verrucomicrobiae bacterium]|nr:OmpA family protein [Verrucomicrobiae bacterium]